MKPSPYGYLIDVVVFQDIGFVVEMNWDDYYVYFRLTWARREGKLCVRSTSGVGRRAPRTRTYISRLHYSRNHLL